MTTPLNTSPTIAPTTKPPVTPASTPTNVQTPAPSTPVTHYTPTQNPTATYGEQSAATLSLQKQLNATNAGKPGYTPIPEDSKYGPLTQAAANYKAPTDTTSNQNTSPETKSPEQQKIDNTQAQLDQRNSELDAAGTQFQNTMAKYINGSVPLTTGEQAQVDGLTQQYQALIDQQKQTNIAAGGTANVRGYQTGAAEYDPTFQAKTIGSITAAGIQKVADLNTKMASAVANLTEKFKTDDMAEIKSAWDEYQNLSEKRTAQLQSTIDKTQAAIKDAHDEAYKIQQDQIKQEQDSRDFKEKVREFESNQALERQKMAAAAASAGGSEDDATIAKLMATGKMAPAEAAKRAKSYNAVLAAANAYSMATTGKPFDIAKADRDYKYATNIGTQNTLNYLGSLIGTDGQSGNLDELKALSDSVSRTKFPALNNANAWTKLQSGDPTIVAYQATVTEVADQIAKILQGGGTGSGTSDAKLAQAASMFNKSFSKDQVDATINAVKPLLANRAKNLIGDNPYLSDYADGFGLSPEKTNSSFFTDIGSKTDTSSATPTSTIFDPNQGFLIPPLTSPK